MRIYIGNLPFETAESTVRDLFEEYGEVNLVAVARDKFTGQSRGYAFVEMPDLEEARAAINHLDESEFAGHVLKVHEAEATENSEYGERKITKNDAGTESSRDEKNLLDKQEPGS